MRRHSKVEKEYFKCQLQRRDDVLESEPHDSEACRCKILKWVNTIDPRDGEGPCPSKRTTLTPPRPLSLIFTEGKSILPLRRKHQKTPL